MSASPEYGDTGADPKTAAQWIVLVFWAAVMIIWAWYLTLLASLASIDDPASAMGLLTIGGAPAAIALWKYPTGRLFRGIFGLLAFSLPGYLVSAMLVGLLRS